MQLKSLNWIEYGTSIDCKRVSGKKENFEKQKSKMVDVAHGNDDLCHGKQPGDTHFNISKCAI